jgi:hypothetical protein
MTQVYVLIGEWLEADFYFVSVLRQPGEGKKEGEENYVDSLQH